MTKLVNENGTDFNKKVTHKNPEIDKNNETQHIESIEEEKKSKKRKRDKKEKKSKKQKREKREKQLGSLTSSIFSPENDFSSMKLRSDHQNRPIWVCPNNRIFLESFSPIYQQAYDFLVAISEPVSRPELIHEYVLTSYSLFAAVSIGLETEQIINVLDKLSKVEISESVADFIRRCTSTYGKVKLVLKSNRFFIESAHRDVLEALLRDPVIASSKIDPNPETDVIDEETGLLVHVYDEEFEDAVVKLKKAKKQKEKDQQTQQTTTIIEDDDVQEVEDFVAQAQKKSSGNRVLAFEIDTNKVEHVKKRCIELDLPTLEEYDFRNDTNNPNLPIDLKPTTSIRSYQEKSLSKMFGNGRARSGIIVLPCGAGKTLVGITAACTVKKSTLVLCTNAVSVEQWYEQFKLWSNVPENRLIRFTSERKEKIPEDGGACALFTTYNMLTYSGQRGFEGKEIMQEIQNREWGLMLLDEVHVVPADTFRRVISVAKAHAKLGLTATLVREDHKEEDLYFLIGPKLYEANWLDLQKAGYLATVQCVEVWCPMTPEFYREYLNASASKKKLLYVMNPNKFRACEFLIRYHEQRGDKIIVFSDNVYALEKYAKAMGKPFIHGPTHQRERMEILRRFKNRTDWNCIFISKVGDTSIDLPDTSVIIQISSHFGSRRQEAQRLGRILRPKSVEKRGINAYFYSLVSQDTYEMFYSTKRQQFLINQGYAFKVLPNITEIIKQNEHMISVIKTKRDELNLLAEVKAADDSKAITERAPDDDFAPVSTSRRSRSSLKILSGAGDSMYMEIPGGRRSRKKSEGVGTKSYTSRHPLFRKRYGK